MRWGVPPFSGKRLIGHVANLASVFWRPWLKSPWRAVVPVSAFAEWGAIDNRIHWFSDPRNRSLWLAAVWRPVSGKRTSTAPDPNDEPVFALVNSPANRLVAASHPSSMPTLLRTSEIDTWLHAPGEPQNSNGRHAWRICKRGSSADQIMQRACRLSEHSWAVAFVAAFP
jgi:putative SOS response-associated peptidase YedK